MISDAKFSFSFYYNDADTLFSIRTLQLVDTHFRNSAKCWVSEEEENV